MKNRPFLVRYQESGSGAWAVVFAHSGEQIRQRCPLLEVFESRPDWMSVDEYARISDDHSFVIGAHAVGGLIPV